MKEFFIVANSFAAPFVSDTSTKFVEADTPESALIKHAENYSHPAGLYSATCYQSSDAYHKGSAHLAKWLCNQEREIQQITKGKGSYMIKGVGPGKFIIDGHQYTIENPKAGAVVA